MPGLQRWADEQPLSNRLHLTAEYFRFCGMGGLLVLAIAVIGTIVTSRGRSSFIGHPFKITLAFSFAFVTYFGWLQAGELLRERRRAGAYVALFALVVPMITLIRRAGGPGAMAVAVAIFGVLAILTQWGELT